MINSDLSNIKKWSEDWLITFNPDKPDIMLGFELTNVCADRH
jgi:hypothetical protein